LIDSLNQASIDGSAQMRGVIDGLNQSINLQLTGPSQLRG